MVGGGFLFALPLPGCAVDSPDVAVGCSGGPGTGAARRDDPRGDMQLVPGTSSPSAARSPRSWLLGHGSLPTTPAGVEAGAVAVFLGVRAVDLAQLTVAVPVALRHSTRPGVFVAVLTGFVVESVLLAVVLIRSGRYVDRRWGAADVVVGVSVLLLQPLFIGPQDVTGDWTAWGFACTLSTVVGAGVVFVARREFGLVWRRWPSAISSRRSCTPLPDRFGPRCSATPLPTRGSLCCPVSCWDTWRQLAADAEDARDRAAVAAGEAARLREVERQRLLLHDNVSVLRLLADPDLPDELGKPLRQQAVALSNRVRAFLEDSRSGTTLGDVWAKVEGSHLPALVRVVRDAVGGFADLPVVCSLDLAEGVLVSEPAAEALDLAVRTVLANVRVHAGARAVVVHADADAVEGEWEVTIADDGRGFDLADMSPGFGLRVQVKQNLARQGIGAHVYSAPGEGTRVTMRGTLVPKDRRVRS